MPRENVAFKKTDMRRAIATAQEMGLAVVGISFEGKLVRLETRPADHPTEETTEQESLADSEKFVL